MEAQSEQPEAPYDDIVIQKRSDGTQQMSNNAWRLEKRSAETERSEFGFDVLGATQFDP